MNTVTLIGTLTRNPEITDGGESRVCRMRVAERGGNRDAPLFVDVAAFGRQAEACARYLTKGRHVAIAGRLRFREWKAPDGSRRSAHSIRADRVDFLPGGPEGDPSAVSAQQAPDPDPDPDPVAA